MRLSIVGRSDNKDRDDHNLDLSRRRANNGVHARVGKLRLHIRRLDAAGAGASEPVAANARAFAVGRSMTPEEARDVIEKALLLVGGGGSLRFCGRFARCVFIARGAFAARFALALG